MRIYDSLKLDLGSLSTSGSCPQPQALSHTLEVDWGDGFASSRLILDVESLLFEFTSLVSFLSRRMFSPCWCTRKALQTMSLYKSRA